MKNDDDIKIGAYTTSWYYRVDGEDMVRSTDERLFFVDADDDVGGSTGRRHCPTTSGTGSDVTGQQGL